MTCATIEVHQFFSEASSIRELKNSSQKTDLEKNKTAIPDEKSHGLGTQRESEGNLFLPISDDFGCPVIRKQFQTKSSTSIVALIILCLPLTALL